MGNNLVSLKQGILEVPGNRIEDAYIIGARCDKCGEWYFPKRYICLVCGNRNLETTRLSGKGKIWSHTTIYELTPGSVIREVPYVLAAVELEEKVLVKGILKNAGEIQPRIGMEVEAVFEKVARDKEGNDLVSFKFRIV